MKTSLNAVWPFQLKLNVTGQIPDSKYRSATPQASLALVQSTLGKLALCGCGEILNRGDDKVTSQGLDQETCTLRMAPSLVCVWPGATYIPLRWSCLLLYGMR